MLNGKETNFLAFLPRSMDDLLSLLEVQYEKVRSKITDMAGKITDNRQTFESNLRSSLLLYNIV